MTVPFKRKLKDGSLIAAINNLEEIRNRYTFKEENENFGGPYFY